MQKYFQKSCINSGEKFWRHVEQVFWGRSGLSRSWVESQRHQKGLNFRHRVHIMRPFWVIRSLMCYIWNRGLKGYTNFCIPITMLLSLWNSDPSFIRLTYLRFSINSLNLTFPAAVKLFAAFPLWRRLPDSFSVQRRLTLWATIFTLWAKIFALREPEFLLWVLPTSVATGQCSRALVQQST